MPWHPLLSVVPVVLDPNTSHPCLHLSDNLSDVRFGQWSRQALGYTDKREGCTSVLGSEGFISGTHYWDVEVGDNTTWALGVISEAAIRTRDNLPSSGLWRLGFRNGTYGQGLQGRFSGLSPWNRKSSVSESSWTGTEGECRSSILSPTRISTPSHTPLARECFRTSVTCVHLKLCGSCRWKWLQQDWRCRDFLH